VGVKGSFRHKWRILRGGGGWRKKVAMEDKLRLRSTSCQKVWEKKRAGVLYKLTGNDTVGTTAQGVENNP